MSLFSVITQKLNEIPALQNIRVLFWFYDCLCLPFLPKPKMLTGGKKQVLVIFPLALGDSVMFYGSVPCLRKMYPSEEYELTIACDKVNKVIFDKCFDHVITPDFRKANTSPIARIKMLREMRANYYDLVLDPAGSEECSPNLFASHAAVATKKIGSLSARNKKYQCPSWIRKRVYQSIITEPEKNLLRTVHYFHFWSAIAGEEFTPITKPFPTEDVTLPEDLPKDFFLIYPSASLPVKYWPIDRYAKLATELYKRTGNPLVVCGTKADLVPTREFLSLLDPTIPVFDLLGKTNIPQFIKLISSADLVITNDTSVYHIALIGGCKTCLVSGAYAYGTFSDYLSENLADPSRVKLCVHKPECMDCGCDCIHKDFHTYPCLDEVTYEEVLSAVTELL